jgi:predicted RNA-binding protein
MKMAGTGQESREDEKMCEANVYLLVEGEEELIMESADIIKPDSGSVFIQGIFGQQRWVKGHIKEMNLVNHRIVLEEG